ncbi:hypothetical protein ACEU07_13850 [Chromobacterium violaceum]|uniref:hypothetical protein n=1 Tax=Chromobacterium violaceum TaxID=536 RepID=UPI0035A64485
MGLDIVVYAKGGNKFIFEMPEKVHQEIFRNGGAVFLLSRKLKDYYLADVKLSPFEFYEWIGELDSMLEQMSPESQIILKDLICNLKSVGDIEKAHIAGD